MSEWSVVGVVVVLVGLIMTVIPPVTKLTNAVTKVVTMTEASNERFYAHEANDKVCAEQVQSTLKEHTDKLYDHQTRITVAEEKLARQTM